MMLVYIYKSRLSYMNKSAPRSAAEGSSDDANRYAGKLMLGGREWAASCVPYNYKCFLTTTTNQVTNT